MLHRGLIRGFTHEAFAYADAFVRCWPGWTGSRLRGYYLRFRVGSFGKGPRVDVGSFVLGGENIRIGDDFHAGRNCFLAAHGEGRIVIGNSVSVNANVHINASLSGEVLIGDDVLIGPNCVIRASDHVFQRTDIPIRCQGHAGGRIIIENDVWLGSNVTVVRDVRIGRGAVVAAGAVVTHDVEAFSVVGGVPARLIKSRTSQLNHGE